MKYRLHPGHVSTTLVALAVLSAAGCARDLPAPYGPLPTGGTKVMSAMVDGGAWTTTAVIVEYDPTYMVVRGKVTQGSKGEELSVGFHRTGPGDQVLDGAVGGWFGELRLVGSFGVWMTGREGAKGIVTLTTLTANRVTGTFSFDAAAFPFTSGSPDIRTARNGTFDVTF